MNAAALTLSQVRYTNKAFWRNPASAFFTFAFPLMFLIIFTALLGHFTVRLGSRTINSSSYYVCSLAAFAVGCLLVGVLILAAPRRPRVPQAFLLVLIAFLLVNKVWSPQYAIWLVPLVVLARPRLPAYLFWQAAEVGYFLAIWSYLVTQLVVIPVPADGGIGNGLYFVALVARFLTVTLLFVLVVVDILRPARDVVRAAGEDDPAGGVLADAPDRFVLRLRPRPAFRRLADASASG